MKRLIVRNSIENIFSVLKKKKATTTNEINLFSPEILKKFDVLGNKGKIKIKSPNQKHHEAQ